MGEYNLLFAFIASGWALPLNLFAMPVLALCGYQAFARCWPATTGEHSTAGTVTGVVELPETGVWPRRRSGLVSYSYRVGSRSYESEMTRENLALAGPVTRYRRGGELTVYYSPRAPGFSFAGAPPDVAALIRLTLRRWVLLPLVLTNLGAVILWSVIAFGP